MRSRQLHRDAWPLIAAALALSACKRNDATLVELDTIEPGEECTEGGYLLNTGVDENDDGSLDADEITSSEVVCNGETGTAGSLVKTTPLDPGDPNCPFGGVMVEAGQDDGEGGGTAGDGVLQDGEVDTTEYVCDGEPAFYGTSIEPPAGAGLYTFDASGGTGSDGDGGDGGRFEVVMDSGTIGGGIRVFATGDADASFTYPTVSAYLGLVPLVVSGPLVIHVDPDTNPNTSPLTNGDIYTETRTGGGMNLPRLYRWNDTDNEGEEITGVRVDAGATLTLPYNDAHNIGVGLYVENDFHLAGTLTTEDNGDERHDLHLWVDNFVGESTGLVDLAGDDATSGTGGDGAYFWVEADDDNWNTDMGAIFNQATIDLSGGSGDDGGQGGDAALGASLRIVNAGTILAVGGVASTGNGGDGGYIELLADYGGVLNSGDLDASGGNGVTGGGNADGGGNDGSEGIYIGRYDNDLSGPVRNTGTLKANGGDISGTCASSCWAGNGGNIHFGLQANSLITTGTLSARGGTSTATGGQTYGGVGGDVEFDADDDGGWYADYIPPGDFLIAGNIDVSGGDGGEGGEGGTLDVDYDADEVANSQQIRFLGYTHIYLNGGDGTEAGGDADAFKLETVYADNTSLAYYGPGGSVVNHAPVHLGGGDGDTESGGDGGSFEMYTEDDYGYNAPWEVAINTGEVDLSGGDGANDGGGGGWAEIFGYSGVENTGRIVADGGSGTSGDGGHAEYDGTIMMVSDYGPVINTADLSANGGASAQGGGGWGGILEIVGWEVQNAGALQAKGGNGSMSEGYYGGEGGLAFLHSLWSTTSNTTSTIDVAGGTGYMAGDPGEVFIDGMNVTEDWD